MVNKIVQSYFQGVNLVHNSQENKRFTRLNPQIFGMKIASHNDLICRRRRKSLVHALALLFKIHAVKIMIFCCSYIEKNGIKPYIYEKIS